MYFVYGTKTKVSLKGYFGEPVACPMCGHTYKPALIKVTKYFHIDYLPLIYLGAKWYTSCPICAAAGQTTKETAKAIVAGGFDTTQNLSCVETYDKTNKIRSFSMRDNVIGQDMLIETNIPKSRVKELRKERGLKSIEKITL